VVALLLLPGWEQLRTDDLLRLSMCVHMYFDPSDVLSARTAGITPLNASLLKQRISFRALRYSIQLGRPLELQE
jgi:hypothetical protein